MSCGPLGGGGIVKLGGFAECAHEAVKARRLGDQQESRVL